ncbi:MAG: tetratricopeptide repeat protein [Betaproteobacteria bacterium]
MQRIFIAKLLLACSLALSSALAFALPSPKDIDAAVNAGRLSQAESMLREVIQEKPQSAKAHYELGQVLARQEHYADAQIALKKAKELDPALKFAASPEKFNETFDKVFRMSQGPSTASLASGLSPAVKPAAAEPSFPLSYVLLGVAGLVILALVLRRSKANAATAAAGFSAAPGATMQGGTATAPRGFGAQFTPNAPTNRSGYAPAAQPMGGGMGSGIGGAVIGGLAGVAAGYALSKALEGDQHSNSSNANPADNNNSYVPIDSPAQPDLGGFDAGSDGGWDDSSSSGGDDSW